MKLLPLLLIALLPALANPLSGQEKVEMALSIERHGEKYDVVAKNFEIKQALTALFSLAKIRHTVDWDVYGWVTGDFKGTDLETALQRLTRQVDATYQLDKGVYRVMRRQGESVELTHHRIQRPYLIDGNNKTINSVDVDSADVATVIEDLCDVAGVLVFIDPRVKGKVSVKFDSVRFDVALKSVLDEVNATYARDSTGISVKPK